VHTSIISNGKSCGSMWPRAGLATLKQAAAQIRSTLCCRTRKGFKAWSVPAGGGDGRGLAAAGDAGGVIVKDPSELVIVPPALLTALQTPYVQMPCAVLGLSVVLMMNVASERRPMNDTEKSITYWFAALAATWRTA
jgi:hypothetical protein